MNREELIEAIVEVLSDELLAKIRKKKIYKRNVRSRMELMDRIGKTTTSEYGRVTRALPAHRVFSVRFKNPVRLPEEEEHKNV